MKTPEDVAQEFRDFDKAYPDANYTFAHVVIADYNLSHADIRGCFEADNLHFWANQWLMEQDDELRIEEHYLNTAAAMKFLHYLQTYDDEFLEKVADIIEPIKF